MLTHWSIRHGTDTGWPFTRWEKCHSMSPPTMQSHHSAKVNITISKNSDRTKRIFVLNRHFRYTNFGGERIRYYEMYGNRFTGKFILYVPEC